MQHQSGILCQLSVLAGLPVLVIGQLRFDYHFLVMPISLMIGIVVFWIGTKLRES